MQLQSCLAEIDSHVMSLWARPNTACFNTLARATKTLLKDDRFNLMCWIAAMIDNDLIDDVLILS